MYPGMKLNISCQIPSVSILTPRYLYLQLHSFEMILMLLDCVSPPYLPEILLITAERTLYLLIILWKDHIGTEILDSLFP